MDKLELRRQISHVLFGLGIVLLLYFDFLNVFILFDIIFLTLVFSFFLRHYKIPALTWLSEIFDRPEDIKRFPAKGMLMFLIGVFLVVWLFTKDVAMAAILILTFGDGISTFVGKQFGKTKFFSLGKKTWEGSSVGFVVAFLSVLVFLPWPEALIASFVGMTAEAFEIRIGKWEINDNIVVPLVSASTIWFMRFVI